MAAATSSAALIGSNLPTSKLAEELSRVDFGAKESRMPRAQPVKMNGRGQIAGNLLRSDRSLVEAVVWEIRLPRIEENIREVLRQLPQTSPTFTLKAELQTALDALADNDYEAAASSLSAFLERVTDLDSSIPETQRARWTQSMRDSLERINHFTVLK